MAVKDAALRAYTALQKAGLLNEHLLPADLPDPVGVECDISDQRESMILIRDRVRPWRQTEHGEESLVTVTSQWHDQSSTTTLHINVPWTVEEVQAFNLHWTATAKIEIRVRPRQIKSSFTNKTEWKTLGRKCTQLLFDSVLLGRDKIRERLSTSPLIIFPVLHTSELLTCIHSLERPRAASAGRLLVEEQSLVRMAGQTRYTRPFIYRSTEMCSRDQERFPPDAGASDSDQPEAHFMVRPLPKRLDYLHPHNMENFNTALDYIPAVVLQDDPLPVSYAQMMILVPSILHRLEVREVARLLRRDLLAPIGLKNLDLVEISICAPSAQIGFNYDRIELLGDSILKLWTSCHVVAQFPDWHEAYLSKAKSRIVSNAHLSRQAVKHGLDRYIHTEAFVSSRWRPPVSTPIDHDNATSSQRQVSTKLLGDVVEALIGASFLDSEEEEEKVSKVQACLRLFLDTIDWKSPADCALVLQALAPETAARYSEYESLKPLMGYSFSRKVLLNEGLTNPSHHLAGQGNYQRLEYLGDAVLELAVVERIGCREHLSHVAMHRAKESVVNAHILAFACLDTSIEAGRVEVKEGANNRIFHIEKAKQRTRLWEFMRHSGSRDLLLAQQGCVERYQHLRHSIQSKLEQGREYPWCELLSMDAPKFFSDIIESTLGAIFVDSGGDMEPCREYLRRLGLFKVLDRVIAGELDAIHPKGRLGIVSGSSVIEYTSQQENTEEGMRYACRVSVDGKETASCCGQISKAAAEARVAHDAIKVVLKARENEQLD